MMICVLLAIACYPGVTAEGSPTSSSGQQFIINKRQLIASRLFLVGASSLTL
jgi:hypothetical protein